MLDVLFLDNGYFHQEEVYETFENDGNSTKRIKLGKVQSKDNEGNITTKLIHEADDGNGNKLSPQV